MKRVLAFFCLIFALPCMAMVTVTDYETTLGDISNELTTLNQEIKETEFARNTMNPYETIEERRHRVYEKLINHMRDLKNKYANNPYIRVSGFSLTIGASPSVQIHIQFN